MLNSINILVIGYTISQLVPIALTKQDSSTLEREDFEAARCEDFQTTMGIFPQVVQMGSTKAKTR